MKGFTNYLNFPGLLFSVVHNLSVQRKFLHSNIHPILSHARKNNDGTLDENDFRKITHYYALAVPAILGEAFCVLRGRPMSDNERWASTAQGAMTGLFDDFHDKGELSEIQIENKLEPQSQPVHRASNEKIFELFYDMALQHVPDQNHTKQGLKDVYLAQVKSKRQKEKLDYDTLKDITFLKGGASLIFYRSAFFPVADDAEKKLLFNLGGLMQLSNDIFDVYKDRESGIHTMVTESENIHLLREEFTRTQKEHSEKAFSLGYEPKNLKKFLGILSLGIFSRCYVCMDQLEKNEQKTGGRFKVHEYTRSQLICDMDTKKNMLRSAAYHFKLLQ